MSARTGVTIQDVAAIRALRLYHFTASVLSKLKWYEVYDTLFSQMNPELGPNFILRHIAGGFSNIEVVASPSIEHAASDLATVLRGLAVPDLQAFVQVCEFTIGDKTIARDKAWLVSFISGGTCALDQRQAQVVFLGQSIGLVRQC